MCGCDCFEAQQDSKKCKKYICCNYYWSSSGDDDDDDDEKTYIYIYIYHGDLRVPLLRDNGGQ